MDVDADGGQEEEEEESLLTFEAGWRSENDDGPLVGAARFLLKVDVRLSSSSSLCSWGFDRSFPSAFASPSFFDFLVNWL
jgi:hypothetical protein